MGDLVLSVPWVGGRDQWKWLLSEAGSGTPLADFEVALDPGDVEYAGFVDLYRWLRWNAEPDRRMASEGELTARVGAWVGSRVVDDFAVSLADRLYGLLWESGQPVDAAVRLAVADVAGPAPSAAAPAISLATPAVFGARAVGLRLQPPRTAAVLDPRAQQMAWFPDEPRRFVGRTGPMAAATAALASESGRTAVLLHGMAGAGKTACAVELAYRHETAFTALAFWQAPTRGEEWPTALTDLAQRLESQLRDHGFTMVDRIGTLAELQAFLPRLTQVLERSGLLLVLDNLETLLDERGDWRDPAGPPWSRR